MRAYLERARASAAHAAHKRRLAELIAIRPGETVLDLGCELGEDALAMAAAAGPAGLVIGLDHDPAMLEGAATLPVPRVRGDGACLPFARGRFDAVRIDRMLHLVADGLAVLREAAALLVPHGRLLVAEPAWSTLEIVADDGPAAGKIGAFLAGEADTALVLPGLVAATGLRVERIETATAEFTELDEALDLLHVEERLMAALAEGRLVPDDVFPWLLHQRAKAWAGGFMARLSGRIVLARR